MNKGPFIYVLGTQPRQNVLGTCSRYTSVHITSTVKCSRYPFVQVENGTHLGLRSMTYCVYTAQRVRSFWCALSVLIAVCVLSPAHLEHCSRYTSVHTCFGCVLRGRFVPRTLFDHVPAGTVLAGTILFRIRSDYKYREHRTCSRWNCTENKYERPVWVSQVCMNLFLLSCRPLCMSISSAYEYTAMWVVNITDGMISINTRDYQYYLSLEGQGAGGGGGGTSKLIRYM